MKKILFVHDLFSSSSDYILHDLIDCINDFEIIVPELPFDPEEALGLIRESCRKNKPDLVVGYKSGSLIAQQMFDYVRILIDPEYEISNMLDSILMDEEMVKFPYVSERASGNNYITITPAIIEKYVNMEEHQFDGLAKAKHEAYGLFWFDENEYNHSIHMEHYHEAAYLPGKNCYDEKAVNGICNLINSFK